MKFLQNIFCFLAMILLMPSMYASNLLYQKNIAHNHHQAAQRLIEESFVTPEIQWSVLSCLGKSEMVINPMSGQVQDMPRIDEILGSIQQKVQQPMYNAQKESVKQAAHALLEAVDIALFVTSIESVYQPHNQQATTQVIAQLNSQKQAINSIISAINNIKTIDQAASSSYFSWIPYFGSGNGQQVAPLSSQQISFSPSSHRVAIPASLMPTIIKINDYKEMSSDPVQAANLLFKECFIAQQHHLKDMQRIEKLALNLQSPISAQNYIFTQFPNLYNSYTATYPICQIAQQMVNSQPPRYSLQDQMTVQHQQAHQLLLHIRQAIQTALYIANKNSSYNAGSMLSSSITSWLDGIVNELMKYDAYLAQLCKDPLYGATQADLDLDTSWSTTAKIAGGLVVTAGVVAATVYFNPLGAGTAVTQVGSAVYGSTSTAAGVVKNLVPSVISNIWGGSATTSQGQAVQGPQQDTQQHLNNINQDIFNTQQKIAELESQQALATTRSGKDALGYEIAQIKQKNIAPLIAQRQNIQQQIQNQNNAVDQAPAQGWGTTAANAAGKIWGVASDASGYAMAGSGMILTAAQIAKAAEKQGLTPTGTYNKYTGGYGNQIEQTAGAVLAVGGGVAGINQISNSWNKLKDPTVINPKTGEIGTRGYVGYVKDVGGLGIDAIKAALISLPQAVGAGIGLSALATQGFAQLTAQQNQIRHQQGQPTAHTQPVPQITPQQIYEILQKNSAESDDPFGTLVAGIKIVDEQGMADPLTIVAILEQIKIDSAANPEFSNKVGQFAQAIAQNLQAAA